MPRIKGLGKGIADLLEIDAVSVNHDAVPPSPNTDGALTELPLSRLSRGLYQPRQHFDAAEIEELSQSIRSAGVIQPIIVRQHPGSSEQGYEIVAGERRWLAAQKAGLSTIPAIIRDLPDRTVAAITLIENIQRKDLNPVEEARGMAVLKTEFSMTHQDIGEVTGRSRAHVTNLLRLLKLAQPILSLLERGDLDMGHARALLQAPEEQRLALAQSVVEKGLSVRETEFLVRQPNPLSVAVSPRPKAKIIKRDEARALSDQLTARVEFRHRPDGEFDVHIRCASESHLQHIIDSLS